jgi:hypothetical protein
MYTQQWWPPIQVAVGAQSPACQRLCCRAVGQCHAYSCQRLQSPETTGGGMHRDATIAPGGGGSWIVLWSLLHCC